VDSIEQRWRKHIGATASLKRLLSRLRDHCLSTERKYLYVTDGAKALRAVIEEPHGQTRNLMGRPGR
jgi:hypothetical protein